MVAENKEAWFTGDSLTVVLALDDAQPIDSPPHPPKEICNLCSEARYEVRFLIITLISLALWIGGVR